MKTESEIKYSLRGVEDHRKLVGPGGLQESRGLERQENYYLDTLDLRLSRERAMLRIRNLAQGGSLLTLKRGSEIEAGYFRSSELESPLPPGSLAGILESPPTLYQMDLAPVGELRSRFGELPLRVIGTLVNERRLFQSGGFLVEVDRISFPDGSEEYEVEVETETPAVARKWLESEFRRLGVNAAPSRETKFARLLRWLSTRLT